MLAIDRLIHEFHYSLRQPRDLPTRPVGVNLIQGRLRDVITFLNTLTYGEGTLPMVRHRLPVKVREIDAGSVDRRWRQTLRRGRRRAMSGTASGAGCARSANPVLAGGVQGQVSPPTVAVPTATSVRRS